LDLLHPSFEDFPKEDFDVAILFGADFGGSSTEDLIRAEMVNAIGSLKVANFLIESSVPHIIYISSVSAGLIKSDDYFSMYGLSKRHAEDLLAVACSLNGVALTVLRPSAIYDFKGTCYKHQPLMYEIVRKAVNGEPLVVNGDQDPLRNYIFIDDVVEVIARSIESVPEGVFMCASPENISLLEIAEIASRTVGKKLEYSFNTSLPNIKTLDLNVNVDLYEILDFYPKVSIEEGIAGIVNSLSEETNT
jgi:nucleoside-diphosphate-sugar epimerase